MELKYIVFWSTLLIGVPVGVILGRMYKNAIHFFFFSMLLFINEPERFGLNFMSREYYRTTTRGFEFTLVDIIAIIIFFIMFLRPKEFKLQFLPPMVWCFLLYVFSFVISMLLVQEPTLPVPGARHLDDFSIYPPEYEYFEVWLYPLFELSKIIRGIGIFWIGYNYLYNTKNYDIIVYCSAASIFYSTGIALQQRYISGLMRVYAHIGHANSLATYMAMHGVVALVGAVRSKRLLSSLFLLSAAVLAIATIIMTVSRAGLAFLLLAYLIIAVYTLRNFLSARNLIYICVSVLCLFIMSVIAFDTLKQRFFQDAVSDYQYRNDYNIESVLMVKDHWFGVGPGNYSAFSWYKYGELANPRMVPGTPAHNFVMLNLAELGVLGLFAFMLIWFKYYQYIYRLHKAGLNDFKRSFLFSLEIAILVMTLQELLNFSFRQMPVLFTAMIFCAAVAALYQENVKTDSDKIASNS